MVGYRVLVASVVKGIGGCFYGGRQQFLSSGDIFRSIEKAVTVGLMRMVACLGGFWSSLYCVHASAVVVRFF